MAFLTQQPVIDLLSEQQPTIYYIDDGTVFCKGVGLPEGTIFAGAGSIITNASGQMFLKTTGTSLNTGWVEVLNTLIGVQRIETQFNSVSNVAGGLDDLHTGTIAAGTLAVDGQFIDWLTSGSFAANANTKRFVMEIAGQGTLLDTGLLAQNGGGYIAQARLTRTTSTNLLCSANIQTTSGVIRTVNNTNITVLNLASNAFFPKSRAESGAAASNDITENLYQTVFFK